MIAAALSAFREILTPPFRAVLLKSLILTLVLLVALWLGFEKLVGLYVELLARFININSYRPWIYDWLGVFNCPRLGHGCRFLS